MRATHQVRGNGELRDVTTARLTALEVYLGRSDSWVSNVEPHARSSVGSGGGGVAE
jgi:hypothetical protein